MIFCIVRIYCPIGLLFHLRLIHLVLFPVILVRVFGPMFYCILIEGGLPEIG